MSRSTRSDRWKGGKASRSARVVPYEERLSRDLRWALTEGSIFFEGKGDVQKTLRRVSSRLNELGIPYAVVGGLAVFQHGVRRFTEDIDILVTRESLQKIHESLEGLGYVAPFAGSKNLRDTESGVKIEFLITGGYPGDGKAKPVSFPDPATASVERDGIRYINLQSLIELKLASGMTGAGRQKDLGDVVALIRELNLPANLSEQLNPYVRELYGELWRQARRRYVRLWRREAGKTAPGSLDELTSSVRAAGDHAAADELMAMNADGIVLETDGADALLVTNDPEIAKKYDMHERDEYWDKR